LCSPFPYLPFPSLNIYYVSIYGTLYGAIYGRIYGTIYGTINLSIHQPPPQQWGDSIVVDAEIYGAIYGAIYPTIYGTIKGTIYTYIYTTVSMCVATLTFTSLWQVSQPVYSCVCISPKWGKILQACVINSLCIIKNMIPFKWLPIVYGREHALLNVNP